MTMQIQPKNNRSLGALNRNYNSCVRCKRHHQKCSGFPCKRCVENKWECKINSINRNVRNDSPSTPSPPPDTPQQPEIESSFSAYSTAEPSYTIVSDRLYTPELGRIINMLQHENGDGMTVIHARCKGSSEEVLKTECDADLKPIGSSQVLDSCESFRVRIGYAANDVLEKFISSQWDDFR